MNKIKQQGVKCIIAGLILVMGLGVTGCTKAEKEEAKQSIANSNATVEEKAAANKKVDAVVAEDEVVVETYPEVINDTTDGQGIAFLKEQGAVRVLSKAGDSYFYRGKDGATYSLSEDGSVYPIDVFDEDKQATSSTGDTSSQEGKEADIDDPSLSSGGLLSEEYMTVPYEELFAMYGYSHRIRVNGKVLNVMEYSEAERQEKAKTSDTVAYRWALIAVEGDENNKALLTFYEKDPKEKISKGDSISINSTSANEIDVDPIKIKSNQVEIIARYGKDGFTENKGNKTIPHLSVKVFKIQ